MQLLKTRAMESGSRQASVFGVAAAFVAFITAVMAARVYVRTVMLRALGTDDILMIVGTIFGFGLSGASMAAAYYGVGRHYDDIPDEDYVPMLKSIYSTRLLYVTSLLFVKVSLLIFYLRLDHRRPMKWAVYALLFVVIGLSISSFFILAFSCFPPSKFWDVAGTGDGKCMDPGQQQIFYEANGILNIITDVFIYIVPIPMLWGVRISTRRKGAIFAVFGLGILSIAAGGVRYDFVRKLANNPDQYYFLADSLNWCSIEIYVAIFCGSAPSLSVLVKTYAPAILGSSGGRGPTGTSGAQGYNPSGQGASYRLSTRGTNQHHHRRLEDTTELDGSQEEIIQGRRWSVTAQHGIMMKTEVRLEVNDRDDDMEEREFRKHKDDHFRFGK
ncbi:hypothetical protein BJY01DRAFT_246945 [Aspergillus pseudoustus]|uniref:Rhodopsin domain-containing protein n=1 Tax=Aspergillus pseudoustus TaxID=1810923 RepID=A0ABR4K4C0_9EURO